MPPPSLAAIRRVLWLEDEVISCPVEDLDTLDGAMRVLDSAYAALEQAALRCPRGHMLREASLRVVGARRTWLAIAAEARPGNEELEREASHELELARAALRRLHGELVRDAPRPPSSGSNVVSLASRRRSS
ncbi:MAG: hypothetical protein K1X94_25565 [Sandaracinaceae bacterium]|nr:hypothetical protein [Sandaracinaceae bacterium]